MKKYGKVMALALVTMLLTIVPAYAKEMTVNEIGDAALTYEKNARFIFVVGKYAYTSNYPNFSTQDIMLAAADSIEVEKVEDVKNLVKNMTIYRIDRTYDKNYQPQGWKLGNNQIGNGTALSGNEKVDIRYVDYNYVGALDIEANVKKSVEELNKTLSSDEGFSSVTYENHTATFNISDPSKDLVSYKEKVMNLLTSFVGENGAVSVTYKDQTTDLKKENLESTISALAGKVLRDMAGVEEGASALNLASVANKTAKAIVKYVDDEGNSYSIEYTLKFVYNFKVEKDKALTNVAKGLDQTIKSNGNKEKYGFNGVTYNNKKLTFDIYDPSKTLATFADSGIVDLFKANYAGAIKVEYSMDGKEKETIELNNKDLTEAEIKKYAAQVLVYMAKGEAGQVDSTAKTLELSTVAGKTLTATVTYADNTVDTYTLEFTFNVEEVKDEVLTEYAAELNEEQGFLNMGFKSVDYDSNTNTVTFNINNPDGQFYKSEDQDNSKAIQSIVNMFNSFAAGATEVTYTVNGNTCSDETCKVTFSSDADANKTNVMKLALQLLGKMSTSESVGSDISVGSVAGSYADATFTYVNGKTVTYRVKFDYDIKESIYESLTGYASGLKEIDSKSGQYFDNIVFDEETGTATFTYKSDKSSSKFVDYANKQQVVDMFNVVTKYATSFTWSSGTQSSSCTKGDDESCTATKLAKELLTAMAKAKGSSEVSNPADLKLSDVADQKATATVTYKVGKVTTTVDLSLIFVSTTE